MNNNPGMSGTIIGLAAAGSAVTGIASFVIAFFPFFNGDYAATGICFLAAAFSFGLLANAVFRT